MPREDEHDVALSWICTERARLKAQLTALAEVEMALARYVALAADPGPVGRDGAGPALGSRPGDRLHACPPGAAAMGLLTPPRP
jgi:hypothetical protein